MSSAILYTPPSENFAGLVDNPFFDSSVNLAPLFVELHGKCDALDGFAARVGYTPECTRTLRETMALLWTPRAWMVEFAGFSYQFDSVERTIGGGGYYPRFTDQGDFSALGIVGSYYLQLPICDNPLNPVHALYDPGWYFTLIDGVNSANNRTMSAPVCGSLVIRCGSLVITESLYGSGISSATMTAIF